MAGVLRQQGGRAAPPGSHRGRPWLPSGTGGGCPRVGRPNRREEDSDVREQTDRPGDNRRRRRRHDPARGAVQPPAGDRPGAPGRARRRGDRCDLAGSGAVFGDPVQGSVADAVRALRLRRYRLLRQGDVAPARSLLRRLAAARRECGPSGLSGRPHRRLLRFDGPFLGRAHATAHRGCGQAVHHDRDHDASERGPDHDLRRRRQHRRRRPLRPRRSDPTPRTPNQAMNPRSAAGGRIAERDAHRERPDHHQQHRDRSQPLSPGACRPAIPTMLPMSRITASSPNFSTVSAPSCTRRLYSCPCS